MKVILNPRRELFLLFMLANVYSIGYVITTGRFLALDSAGDVEINFKFIVFSILFLFSYYFLLFPAFRWFGRINFGVPSLFYEKRDSRGHSLGIAIFSLQFIYFLFVIAFDAGKVGVTGIDVPFSNFWALIQIDFLATYYFVLSKKDNLWKMNILLYAVSNITRGWTGFILILAFVYFVRRESPFVIKGRIVFLGFVVSLIFIPLVLYAKFYVRTRQVDLSFDEFLGVVFGYDNYWDFLKYSIEYSVNRIQQFSLTWFVWDASNSLSSAYDSGLISPFWSENLYGNFLLKSLGLQILPNLGIYATQYIPYDFEVILGSFNISPGLIGWIGVAGNSVFGLICYLFFLSAFGFLLIQIMCKRGSKEWLRLSYLLWFMWLTLLLPGWINQFVAFLHSAIIFIIVYYICKKFYR